MLMTKRSENDLYNIYACQKCAFYITALRFNEIVSSILHPKKFPMPEAPEFIKELRTVDKPVE